MKPNSETRKPVDQLELRDLTAYPVWEFAIEEEGGGERDETWVRPVVGRCIPRVDFVLAIAATFTTKGGQEFDGMLWANTNKDLEIEGGSIITQGRYLPFSLPLGPFPRDRTAVALALGFAEQAFFPLGFTLRLPLEGEQKARTGTFP